MKITFDTERDSLDYVLEILDVVRRRQDPLNYDHVGVCKVAPPADVRTVAEFAAPRLATPPVAPAAETPPPPVAAPIELDAAGMPWDARIHSTSKAKVVDGTWRQRRNLDPAIKASVETELRARVVSVATPPPAPPVASAAIVPPPPPVETPASDAEDFPALIARITTAMQANTIKPEQLTAAVAKLGLPGGLLGLHARPDLMPAMRKELFGE